MIKKNELLKPLSDDLKTQIEAWNDIDVRIFNKANETFWERYNAIPNVKKLEQEFKYETGILGRNGPSDHGTSFTRFFKKG